MTKQEFLLKLSEVKDRFEWVIDSSFNIRGYCEGVCYCPITAVNYVENSVYTPVDNVDLAWKRLGIDACDAETIIGAADANFEEGFRAQLKLILGFQL